MHEFGIMASILDSVTEAAEDAGATKVLSIRLTIGEMTQIVEDAMQFALEVLAPGTICEQATLEINFIKPKSKCPECGTEFEHDMFSKICPNCGNPFTEQICGKEMYIDNIEVDV